MKGNFDNILGLVLKEEGGFVMTPKDPGDMTNLGVTKRAWERFVGHEVDEAEMRNLTIAAVAPLYKQNYWDRVNGDGLPLGLDYAVMDCAVNNGTALAAKFLQQACGVDADGVIGPQTMIAVHRADPIGLIQKLCDQRLASLQSLPTFATFGRGWKARIARVEAASQQMAQSTGPFIPPVAGYVSDSVPCEGLGDELGIGDDVGTLCSVVLAKDVHPPLAIGLFGDWGTGKSYFMEAMYSHIEDLARRSAGTEHTAYHGSVVQIRFNAWHYIDANLWASLVSHIFDELAKKVCPEEKPEETKKRLLQELDSAKQIREEAAQEKQLAESQKRTAEQALNSAIEARRNKEVELADLHPSDLLQLLTPQEQEQLKSGLADTLKALGVPPAVNSLSELEDAYREAFSLAGRVQSVLLSFWRARNPTFLVVLVTLMFVAVPVASWAFSLLLKAPWLAGVNTTLGEIAVALGGVAAGLKKHLGTASRYLDDLQAKRDSVLTAIRNKQEQKSAEELRLQGELAALLASEEIAQKRVEEADSRVREIQRKLDDIEAGRSLSKFILERVQAEDYRKYLGIVSTIRKDFERLGNLLKEGKPGLDKVGRLILYIDDLDRCPSDKVVEVLQAVHLLLAMPLFVAVVGVDLRWLLHSLENQYTAFHETHTGQGSVVRPEWVTSPQNYLEKIFQIPFNLRSMEIEGYQRLVSVLLPEPTDRMSGTSTDVARSAKLDQTREGNAAVRAQTARQGDGLPVQTETPRQPDLNPSSLQIQSWEREFAQTLFAFIPTPRAAKRFVNVYRLLKAPLSGDALRNFEGTEDQPRDFQAAMLLLAVVVGMPQQADKLFKVIMSGGNPGTKWQQFFTENLSLSAAQSGVLAKVGLGVDLSVFRVWAPRVARFTFETAKSTSSAGVEPQY